MKKRALIWVPLTALVVVILIIGVILALKRCPTVLYRYVAKGSVNKKPEISILNPLRDRAPERAANEFLKNLGTDECLKLLTFPNGERDWAEDTCAQERRYPLYYWSLIDRDDISQSVRLFYQGNRANGVDKIDTPIRLTVENLQGVWTVTWFECFY